MDSKNYTTESGSTIIILKDEYLKTLSAGTYDLKATYTNGSEDTTTFKINGENVSNEEVKEENPHTFDGIALYFGLGILSIIGIAGIARVLKNGKH